MGQFYSGVSWPPSHTNNPNEVFRLPTLLLYTIGLRSFLFATISQNLRNSAN